MKLPMHPVLALFLKITAVVALAIVLVFLLGFLVKVVVVAAIVAALAVGGFLVFNFFRRRSSLPVIR